MSDEEYRDFREIFEVNHNYLSDSALDVLGWREMETFAADLIHYGLAHASDDPVGFIRSVFDQKFPLFKKPDESETERKRDKFEQEVRKAYS